MIKKQRESVIKQVGKVREENLPDIQLDANMQAQRQFMEGVKGK
jgi:phosphopantetheinyl transferase